MRRFFLLPWLPDDMNSKIIITLFSLFAELERDLISLRTKEALNAKRIQGITLGKPIGFQPTGTTLSDEPVYQLSFKS